MFGGEWTEQKLDALADYLKAYKRALSKQRFWLEYIDAFAGTGYRQRSEFKTDGAGHLFPELAEQSAQKYLDGSAVRALQLDSPFNAYRFVELDPAKATELEKLKELYPTRASLIHVVQEEANAYLLRRSREDWLERSARAVVFVDPFGMQVEWTTIESLARTKAVDLWLLFPVSAINRLMSRDGVRYDSWKSRLDLVFGDGDWFGACYREQSRHDLFEGETSEQVKAVDLNGLTEYMVEKLDKVFAGVVKKPMILRSRKGHPLFALCFAAANPNGAEVACPIAEYILGK